MGLKANKPTSAMLSMPLDSAWLFARGEQPRLTKKYDLTRHPRYHELPEARRPECQAIKQKEAVA